MKERIVSGRVGRRAVRIESVAFMMAAIAMMAPGALGTDHPVSATGSTYIDQYGCDATVNAPNMPIYLNVTNGDSVTIYYNYTYDDYRSSGPYIAGHVFSQVVQYGGGGVADSHGYNTTGNQHGSGGIQRTVNNVQEGGSIWVNWYANITSASSPACSISDSDGGYIYLY